MALPLVSLPSLSLPVLAVLLVLAIAIPVAFYMWTAGQSDNPGGAVVPSLLIGAVLVTVVALLALSSFGLVPTVTLPALTITEWAMVLAAATVPVIVYKITRMTRVVNWFDVAVAMALMIIPAVVVLGLHGAISGAAATGLIGIMVAHALGIIDTN